MNLQEKLIQSLISNRILNPAVLALAKRKFAKKYRLPCPKNSALLKTYHDLIKQKRVPQIRTLEQILHTREIRSLSGIVSISVLTKPWPCPGRCLYCPSVKGLPKSYLDGEPAVMRALAHKFNPYKQVQARLAALKATGHQTNKIELIVIGGTWSFLAPNYQDWFIEECFRAANNYGADSEPRIRKDLSREQERNETAKNRIIGITIETRPDFIDGKEIKRLRKLGVTRVELGVQTLDDKILLKNRRGHNIAQTVKATKLLKDSGFKVCYHIMPNLPGSNLDKDERVFSELFANPDFQPDFLKIYPCVVVKQAPLYWLWLKKQYRPYSDRQLIKLLVKVKQKIPPYCRIIRIYRDIPSPQIMTGSKISNLRQVIAEALKREGKKCLCIRCREVKRDFSPKQNLKIFRQDYAASGDKEIFLSYEDKKRQKLYALLRLRLIPESQPAIFPVLKQAAVIREVHTYGQTIGFSKKSIASPQHRSLGKNLIKTAEKIARQEGFKKMAVISGIGARDYYRRLGYHLQNTYMVKVL